jgi:hypothetical protein
MFYKCWKKIRPQRPDPRVASGWNDYYEKRCREAEAQDDGVLWICPHDKEANDILEICRRMEQEHEDEDTEMLVCLVKLRSHLWT